MRITPIVASTFRSDGGAMFGLVPKPLWSKLIPPNEQNAIPQNANCLFVELADGRRGIIDTGCGPAERFTDKERRINCVGDGWPLADRLAALGAEPGRLDFVILTHLHWDHCGGTSRKLPGERSSLTMPNAIHFVHEWEWADATSGDPLFYQSYPAYVIDPLTELSPDRLSLVTGAEAEILPGIRMHRSGGHTRGHCTVILDDRDLVLDHPERDAFDGVTRIVFTADVCPTQHHLRLVFQTAYDTYPLDTRAWKREVLPHAADENTLLIFDHDPVDFGGTIRADARKEFVLHQHLPVA